MEALPLTPAGYCGGWLAHLSSTQRASEVSEVPLSDGGTDGGAEFEKNRLFKIKYRLKTLLV